MPWLFLVLAIVFAAAAYRVGWPAWTAYRQRDARDLNAERYLAWRGRGAPAGASVREGLTGAERRNMILAGALALAAVGWLIAFFAAT